MVIDVELIQNRKENNQMTRSPQYTVLNERGCDEGWK